MNIYAHTAETSEYPEYISVNDRDGACEVTVRSAAKAATAETPYAQAGDIGVIRLDAVQAAELSDALARWVAGE